MEINDHFHFAAQWFMVCLDEGYFFFYLFGWKRPAFQHTIKPKNVIKKWKNVIVVAELDVLLI